MMAIVNLIVKADVDTWCITCVLTDPELTNGKSWETEAEAIAFMQAHKLAYTTVRCYMYRGGNVHVGYTYYGPSTYPANAFMDAFTDYF
jgi:hypothetical protein